MPTLSGCARSSEATRILTVEGGPICFSFVQADRGLDGRSEWRGKTTTIGKLATKHKAANKR
jgi:signal recognition particle GTPase